MQVSIPASTANPLYPSQESLTTLKAEIQALQKQLRQAEEHRALFQAAFDAMPVGTVVLAADGTILQANAAWHHATQAQINHPYGGENYLSHWDTALAAEAPAVAHGVRAVIAGQQPEFRLDAPRPSGKQWQTVQALPFAEPAPRRVVITHARAPACRTAAVAKCTQHAYTEALLHALTALNSTLDVESITKQILASAAMVVPSEAGSILLFEGEVARVAYSRGFSAEAVAAFQSHRFRCEEIVPRGTVAHPHSYFIPDTTRWPAWIALHDTEWIRSSIGVPIIVRGKVIGLLAADSATPHHFQLPDLEKLQAFAHYAGLALENAQQVQRLEAYVAERTVALQAAIEETTAILDNSPDSIFLIQPNLQIARVNQAFHRLFACAREQDRSASLLRFIHSNDTATVIAATQAVQTNGGGQRCEIQALRCDGTVFDAELSLGLLSNSGLVGTIRDITERKRAQTALAEERNLLRTLIDAIPDVVFVKDRDHRVLLRNQAQGVLLPTVPPATVVGSIGADFFAPADAAATRAEECRILATGESILHHERQVTRTDGSKAWISRTKVPLRNLQGEIIGLAGIIQNISQRKAHEQQLRFYASLQESVSDAVITTDVEFRIQSWNRAAEKIYGWRAEEVLGHSIRDVLSTQYTATVTHQEAIQTLLTQENIRGEFRQQRKDGTPIDVLFSVTLLKDPQGSPYGLVTINHDITEQKAAEAALRAQHDLLQQVIDGIPAFILVTDTMGVIQLANQVTVKQLGLTAPQLIGTPAMALSRHVQDLPAFRQFWQQALATGEPLQQECWIRGRLYQATLIPLKNPEAQPDRLLIVATDITNHKEAEATLREALQKEQELGELKSRFLSIASHEFRTPLTTILGLTELLRRLHQQLTSEQITGRLVKIQHQVNHIRVMLDDILLLSQSQQGIFAPVAIDLDALCRTLMEELSNQAEHSERLKYCCDGPIAQIQLDQRLLRQVITNLVTNALKYSPPEKPVHIALTQQGATLVLTVRDEGIGIPAGDIHYLFRPFYRAGNVGKISGTGLGLAIVKDAIERHNGTISVQSERGVGTTFTVTLPIPAPLELAEDRVTPADLPARE